ncbi:MAG: TetR/AcrR family transcriptional regulator [Bacillota bacterium]|jgi:AcrR family transcriptional regulator
MTDKELRVKIKETAVDHFDRFGYHGTTIRNIAKDVNCSLPMIYYYFNNKKELFDEIIKKDYFDLLLRHARQLQTDDITEFYTQYVYRLNQLSDYDKKIYRLGVKVYLSFDGNDELMKVMDEWEQSILPRHYQLAMPHFQGVEDGTVIVRTLIHLLENLIEQIVVKNRFLSEDEIREEITVVLRSRKA